MPPRKYQKREPQFESEVEESPELKQAVETPEPPAPVVVAPPPPNPAVIALQEDIVGLIRKRGEIRARMLNANAALQQAQASLQLVQTEMRTLEEEVHYLHSQCAQLEGRNAAVAPGQYPGGTINPGEALFFMQQQDRAIVSSEPTMPPARSPFASPDGVNRSHAVREVL